MTHASLRFPEVVSAIYSAQLNAARHLPVHKDKSNHGRTWLIAFGNYEGGRVWVESPIGSHAPPTEKRDWQRALRGDYYSVHER